MRTLADIKAEIAQCLAAAVIYGSNREDTEYKKLQKKKKFLDEIEKYLETNPREEFMRKEFERVKDLKHRIDSVERFNDWLKMQTPNGKDAAWWKTQYLKEFDRPKIAKQYTVLSYVLESE